MEKDYEKATVTGKPIPRSNRAGITDAEVEAVLKNAREQLAKATGDTSSLEIKTDQKKRAEQARKAQEEKRAEQARKAQEEKRAEQVRKAQEEKRAGQARKTQEEKRAGQIKKAQEEKKVQHNQKPEFMVEDSVYVDKKLSKPLPENDKITIGNIIGGFLEFIWTIVKITVVASIVVGVVGFLLTRNLMIRGRTGERVSASNMTVAANVMENKQSEEKNVREWLKSVKREKISLVADDESILMARKIVLKADSNNWAVVLHGYNGSMEDIYDIAMHYTKEGYNVLMPDLRANGESEGAFFGMGWTDRLDLINWMDVILEENPSAQIVIHGVDVGADTALMLSGEPLKSSVKAIVAEGAYTSAWDVVKMEYEARYDWPTFPIVNMMNPVTKIWGGYSLKEADAVKQVQKTRVPILLIHGLKDTYATDDMTKKLDKAIASSHEVLEIATGSHGDCRYADPDVYYNKTFEFIGNYVK